MDQLTLLWEYQQEDLANDKLEREIRNSPTRISFVKSRDYLKEQRDIMIRVEGEINEIADRIDIVKDAIKLLEDQVIALQQKYDTERPSNLTETHKLLKDTKYVFTDLTMYESEMKRLKRDAEEHDMICSETVARIAKAKPEYDELKKVFDEENKEKSAILDAKRAKTAEKEQNISPALMDKYKVIKTRCIPPVVKLLADQCGGCNMSLPSVILKKIRSQSDTIECETCGRIIIM